MTTDKRLHTVLEKYWGYNRFLPLQAEAMQCVLTNRDSVVVLPTGGGKSLCFQAPALCGDGLAVVVSPLISLMKDQVDALTNCGVPAAFINSSLLEHERRAVADRVRNGELRLLYLAPEQLVRPPTIAFLQDSNVGFIAIDEAHCISAWGHDFRPEYRQLRVLKEAFPNLGVHAYTATATPQVRQDIANQLRLDNPNTLVGSFDRANLVYKIERADSRLSQVCDVVERHRGESGIVYCITRREVEETAAALKSLGYSALPYHAGMSDADRKHNQEAFITEKVETIVATVAFGMGIDKSNVRYVVHAGMPKSIEAYQQESGRAGRDGLEAECVLIYSGNDLRTLKWIIENSEPDRPEGAPEPDPQTLADREKAREAALQSLDNMWDFCTGVVCRHRALVGHFGQELDSDNCSACDVCLGEVDLVDDPLIVAQKILSCVVRLKQRFGGDYTAKVLKGSKEQRILENGHDSLSTWGILSDENQKSIRSWIEQLAGQGFLRKTGEYNVLEVTDAGWQVLRGETTPRLLKPAPERRDKDDGRTPAAMLESWAGVDRELFEELRQLRRAVAEERGVAPYIVFGDASLRDMARRRPTSLDGFLLVHGVGEKKRDDFGEPFVDCVVEYCKRNDVATDVTPRREKKTAPKLSAARQTAFALFEEKRSIGDVAQSVQRAESTTMQYLAEFIDQAGHTDPTPWVDAKTAQQVQAAIRTVGMERLKPIFDHLDGSVPYDQIRVVVACERNRAAVHA